MEVIDKDEDIEIELPENVDNQRNKDGEIYSDKASLNQRRIKEGFHQIFHREGNCNKQRRKL